MKLNQRPQNIGPQPTLFLKLLRMENIRLTLQQLQCPFAESDAVALLADVTWMDLIAWLLRNYDLNMYENLSKKTFGSAEPSREQLAVVLTQMASLLGLCPPTETKLITGQVKQNQKIDFLKDLTLLCLDAVDARSFGTDLAASSTRDASLISAIAEEQKSIFVNKIALFPLDMEPLLRTDTSSHNIPSEKDIGASVQAITAEVETMKQKLATLRQHVTVPASRGEISTAEVERMTKSITLQFDQMYGLLASFDDIYRNELLPWMSQSHAKPSGLGPAARSCLEAFHSLDSVLNDVVALKHHYSSIMNGSAIQDLRKRTAAMDEQRIAALREDIVVLERAAARRAEAGRA